MKIFVAIILIYLFSISLAIITNKKLKRRGLQGIKWNECFNPIKLFSVLIGFILYILIPEHIFEQYVIRFYDPYCRKNCLKSDNKECTICGCDVYAKMWSPLEKDSNGNWGKIIISRSKYNKLRKSYPVKINIEYGAI